MSEEVKLDDVKEPKAKGLDWKIIAITLLALLVFLSYLFVNEEWVECYEEAKENEEYYNVTICEDKQGGLKVWECKEFMSEKASQMCSNEIGGNYMWEKYLQ